ncbi:MAG: anthranilate synthase component I family protein [Opitutae bacterium]|nr:anthranilate synthase component I family protein [Opitutae bacterium]
MSVLNNKEYLNKIFQSNKPLIIYKTIGGFDVYTDFNERIVLNSKNFKSFLNIKCNKPNSKIKELNCYVGFFGYELLAFQFGIPTKAKRDLPVPAGWFGRPATIIHFNQEQTVIESRDPNREQEIEKRLQDPLSLDSPTLIHQKHSCNLSFEQYKDIFHQAREAILDGETYQIKISQRFEAATQIDPLSAFTKLQKSNPAPEAFLLKTKEFSIVSCSPEVVIHKEADRMITRPIGGTYRRDDQGTERSLIERFLKDPKEVAEHNMLVDLERNDLSSLCLPGTVRLERFREVETYSHLHHLVSTIRGKLRPGADLSQILRGMLPGGSITGCPKARTMEWIDRLEPCFRGPYTGSFGTIENGGNIHLNLIIRSMLVLGNQCYTQAGGGIVVNSTPEYEYRENQIKAQALLDLLQ